MSILVLLLSFEGTTRDTCDGRIVVRLEYEAYQVMAEREIKKICDRIRQQWNVRHICVMHRLGLVTLYPVMKKIPREYWLKS